MACSSCSGVCFASGGLLFSSKWVHVAVSNIHWDNGASNILWAHGASNILWAHGASNKAMAIVAESIHWANVTRIFLVHIHSAWYNYDFLHNMFFGKIWGVYVLCLHVTTPFNSGAPFKTQWANCVFRFLFWWHHSFKRKGTQRKTNNLSQWLNNYVELNVPN